MSDIDEELRSEIWRKLKDEQEVSARSTQMERNGQQEGGVVRVSASLNIELPLHPRAERKRKESAPNKVRNSVVAGLVALILALASGLLYLYLFPPYFNRPIPRFLAIIALLAAVAFVLLVVVPVVDAVKRRHGTLRR